MINKKRTFLLILILPVPMLISQTLFAQQKFGLVIGNSNYTGISRLNNPVNDANDMEAALRELGFSVEKVLDGSLDQMENAIVNLSRRLGASANSYGFFFYAGHGVQSNGDNYLIPVDASGIQTENHLRQRAVSVQILLDNLNDAGNELNMIVLDACRDNPFGWARSGSRGLTVLSGTPAGSIIMYATGANSVAADGSGRNGLFTGQLLANLKTPGLSVFEVFNKTGEGVLRVSNGTQHPELSMRYFGASSVYLGSRPVQPAAAPAVVTPQPAPAVAPDVIASQPSATPDAQPTPTPTVVTPEPIPEVLEFEIVGGRSVTITRYRGSAVTMQIPAQIQGLPVTAIANQAFAYCGNLTGVTIPSSVTSIGDSAFAGCSNLISINIPSSVTSIGNSAFANCSNLIGIAIPPSVKEINYGVFLNCRSLPNIIIPSSVTSIGDSAFSGCSNLSSITIPSSVTSIGNSAFFGCRSFTDVTIPSSVRSIGYQAFFGCDSLTHVSLSRSTQYGSNVFPATTQITRRLFG